MKQIAAFFNGKKTVISGFASLTVGFLGTKGYIDQDTAVYLLTATGILFSVGVGHKVVKYKNAKP